MMPENTERGNEETAFHLLHELIPHLDSTGGDIHALQKAVSEANQTTARNHIDNAEEHLQTAWEILEDGEDAIFSGKYIEHDGDGGGTIHDKQTVRRKAREIEDELEGAVSELTEALDCLMDADSVLAKNLSTNIGVYSTLDGYAEYVRDDVDYILNLAGRAGDNLPRR